MSLISSINLVQNQVQVSDQKAYLDVQISTQNAQTTQNPFIILITIQTKEVGYLLLETGIETTTYVIECDFSGFASGNLEVFVSTHESQGGQIIDDLSQSFTLSVSGLVDQPWLLYMPEPSIAGESSIYKSNANGPFEFSIIKKLVNENGQLLDMSDFDVSQDALEWNVFRQGQDISSELQFDGDTFTYNPAQPLNNGYNELEISLTFEAYPRQTSLLSLVIWIEQQAPNLWSNGQETFANSPFPTFSIFTYDNAGTDPDAFEVKTNDTLLEINVIQNVNDPLQGGVEQFFIQILTPLWDGRHEIKVSASDNAGNRSPEFLHYISIDSLGPKIIAVSPENSLFINAAQGHFIFELSDNESTLLLRQRLNALNNITPEIIEAFSQIEIEFLYQALISPPPLVQLPSLTIEELETILSNINTIGEFNIDTTLYKDLHFSTLKHIIDSSVATLSSESGLSSSQINSLKSEIDPIKDLLSPEFLENIRLGDTLPYFSSLYGTYDLSLDDNLLIQNQSYGGQFIHWSMDQNASFEDGEHIITLIIRDQYGNASSYSHPFDLEKAEPALAFSFPQDQETVNEFPFTAIFRLEESLSGFNPETIHVSINGEDLSDSATLSDSGTVTAPITSFRDGMQDLYFEIDNNVGKKLRKRIYFFYQPVTDWSFDVSIGNKIITTEDHLELTGQASSNIASIRHNGTDYPTSSDGTFIIEITSLEIGDIFLEFFGIDTNGQIGPKRVLTVTRLAENSTAITGRIATINGDPITNAKIEILLTGSISFSNASGQFFISENNLAPGQNTLVIAPPPNEQNAFQATSISFRLLEGNASDLGTITLLPSALDNGQQVGNTGNTVLSDTGTGFTLTLDNTKVNLPEGQEKVAIQVFDADKSPNPIPDGIVPTKIISLEPSGLTVATEGGAPFELQNFLNIGPNQYVPFLIRDEFSRRWVLGPVGKVSSDGTKIISIPGAGIKHFSTLAPVPPIPRIEINQDDRHIPGVNTLNGGLELDIELPGFEYLGETIEPVLSYSSLTAAPTVTITSVFKGLETFKDINIQESYLVTSSEVLNRSVLHVNATQYKKNFWGKTKKVGQSSDNFVNYIPLGTNPYQNLPHRQDLEKKQWVEYSYNVVNTPVEVYEITKEISQEIESEFWPRAISTKYFFGFIETLWRKLLGRKTTRIVNGQEEEINILPPNLSVINSFSPVFSNGNYYPTGLYNFITKYELEYGAYSVVKNTSIARNFTIDYGYFNYLVNERNRLQNKGNRTPQENLQLANLNDAINEFRQIERDIDRDRIRTSSQTIWQDPIDALSQKETGSVVLHNESNSPFGRGWVFKACQKLFPAGERTALVIAGEEKLIFTMSDYIVNNLGEISPNITAFAVADDKSYAVIAVENRIDKITFSSGSVETLFAFPEYENTVSRSTYVKNRVNQIVEYSCQKRRIVCSYEWRFPFRRLVCREEYYTSTCEKIEKGWDGTYVLVDTRPPENILSEYQVNINSIVLIGDDIYMADDGTKRILKLTSAGNLSTVSGIFVQEPDESDREYSSDQEQYTIDSGLIWQPKNNFTKSTVNASQAGLKTPKGLSKLSDTELVFVESDRGTVRIIDLEANTISYFAGNTSLLNRFFNIRYDPSQTNARKARLTNLKTTCTDSNRNIYCLLTTTEDGQVSDVVVKITPNQTITLVGGNPVGTLGTGIDATMHKIVDGATMGTDAGGNLYLMESGRVVQFTPDGFVEDFAGTGDGSVEDGVPALQTTFGVNSLLSIVNNGQIIIADSSVNQLREIALSINGSAKMKMRGPVGYNSSTLTKNTDGTWIRVYKQGGEVHFNTLGQQVKYVDPYNREITYEWQDGLLQRITYPFGQFIEFTYDANGLLSAIEDHAGRQTTFEIQGQDLVKINLPYDEAHEFDYLEDGRMTSHKECVL